jgi:cysteine synthase A
MLINAYGGIIEKVTEADSNGGYLITRIRRVKELNASIKNSYWINQYNNRYNAEAYYLTLGKEICDEVPNIEYVFIGVSSGGTLTGVSNMIKRRYPSAKVIAVDIEGSVIFNTPPKKRLIPGIGSSIVPNILKHAKIDDVVIVDEAESIEGCHSLLNKNQIFAGGSSGAVLAAMKKYFRDKKINRKVKVVTIMADRGERYTNTIYNKDWYSLYFNLPEPIKQKTADIII